MVGTARAYGTYMFARLLRGFGWPSVIMHQTWLGSDVGSGGRYPMAYAMVISQAVVCLASVLRRVSNFSKKNRA